VAFIRHWFAEQTGKASQQKQVRRPADMIAVIPGFRVKGNRTNPTQIHFITSSGNCRARI